MLYDDAYESRSTALRGARKQAQAGTERSQADRDRYNGAMLRSDALLARLLKAFTAVPAEQRAEFVERVVAGAGVNP